MREKPQQTEDKQQPETAANLFDLAQGSDWKVSLSNENSQEREYRLLESRYDSQHRRWRTTILFIFVLIAISIVLYYCLQILINPEASNDDKKWATAISASIVSGGVGFITGSKAVG